MNRRELARGYLLGMIGASVVLAVASTVSAVRLNLALDRELRRVHREIERARLAAVMRDTREHFNGRAARRQEWGR